MSFWNVIDKLDDAISKTVDVIGNIAEEPLKHFQHKRDMAFATARHREGIELANVHAEIENERLVLITELEVSRKTKTKEILAQLDQWVKDKEFQRQKEISDAVIHYQREYNNLVTEFVSTISQLHMDLIDKAQDMIKKRLLDYKDIQKEIRKEQLEEYKSICESMGDDEYGKKMLLSSLESSVKDLLDTSSTIIKDLNDDLRRLKIMIENTTREGQKIIDRRIGNLQIQASATTD